jgi:hypothetical protein
MLRSFVLGIATTCAALFTLVIPQKVQAQYGGFPTVPQYSPYRQPPYQPAQPGPTIQEMGGNWFMSGDPDAPCQVIPSRRGDRALFINENGDQAEGFIRGNRIMVPRWRNLQGRYMGDTIRWANGSVWSR